MLWLCHHQEARRDDVTHWSSVCTTFLALVMLNTDELAACFVTVGPSMTFDYQVTLSLTHQPLISLHLAGEGSHV